MLEVGRQFDRYTIEALLGRGGMGDVYRAYDERLERRVALKIIRAEDDLQGSQGSDGHAPQLLREARAAAALAHPNVVAIFDVGVLDGTTYLAMELIEGRPLRAYVGSDVPIDRRIEWLVDVARALSAAHKKGLVHRDIKPENVMVSGDGMVKVLDFGIAHRSRALPTTSTGTLPSSLTNTTRTGLVGTPMYMAPEQMRGERLDGRADQFSWGVLAYELLSDGELPWPDATDLIGLMTAVITTEAARLPEAPGLSPRIAGVVARALRRSRDERFTSMDEVLVALGSSSGGLQPGVASAPVDIPSVRAFDALGATLDATDGAAPTPSPPAPAPRRRVLPTIGALAALALAISGAALALRPSSAPRPNASATSPASSQRSIAVVGFRNLSGREDASWIGTALSETMTTELAMGEQIRTTSPDDVARMKRDLGLSMNEGVSLDALPRVGKRLGAELLVTGAYLAVGGKIRLDVRLLDTRSSETIASLSESGQEAELIDVVSRAGAALRRVLRVREISPDEARGVRASQPASAEAARAHADGLARLRAFDGLGARAAFERAIALEPRFAPSHAALADAHSLLGLPELAGEAAKRAVDLSQGLRREERMTIEARYHEATASWPKAVEIHQALHELFPENLDHGLALARAQARAARGTDALATAAALRRLPPPLGDDPRIDLAEAEAHAALGDTRAEARAAEVAGNKAQALGATTLVIRARIIAGWWLVESGDVARGILALEELGRSAAAIGDRLLSAEIGNMLAIAHSLRGEHRAALERFVEIERTLQAMGNLADLSVAQTNRAAQLIALGHLGEALAAVEAAAQGPKPLVQGRILTGWIAVLRGDLRAARAALAAVLTSLRETQDERMMAWAEALLADVALEQGKLDEAETLARSSLATRERLGLTQFIGESQIVLAGVLWARDGGAEAERLTREAAEASAKAQQRGAEARAVALLAQVLLGAGRAAEAAGPLARAAELVHDGQNVDTRLRVATVMALAQGGRGEVDGAHAALAKSIDEAEKLGLSVRAFEARLASARVDLASGKAPAGRAALTALAREARSRGLLRIADEATRAGR